MLEQLAQWMICVIGSDFESCLMHERVRARTATVREKTHKLRRYWRFTCSNAFLLWLSRNLMLLLL